MLDICPGDQVTFELDRNRKFPRWQAGYDNGGCGEWSKAIIAEVNEAYIITVHTKLKPFDFTWQWRRADFREALPGFLRLDKKAKALKQPPWFYVELDQDLDCYTKILPEGYVSRACFNPYLRDHSSILLLDVRMSSNDWRSSFGVSVLETTKISKEEYIGRKANQDGF